MLYEKLGLWVITLFLLNGCRVQVTDGYGNGIYYQDSPHSSHCESIDTIQQTLLIQINQIRSYPQQCGNQTFPPASPVAWNTQLSFAAANHAGDMAHYDFLEHIGSDSSFVTTRTTNVGYNWLIVGENIGAGYQSTQNMLNAWLTTPNDCANLMNPNFVQVGMACASRSESNSQFSIYWTLVLAFPR